MSEPFSAVLPEELRCIDARRAGVSGTAPILLPPPVVAGHSPERSALDRDLAGMGISGGGIRSATFNLGILQGLADHGVLPQLDYLSTVSGGGYIGSWLHGVILRGHNGDPNRANDQLSPRENPVPQAAADDPITFLRKYSNYLAPRLSVFSTDVWVIASLWLRNMFLNWCVLVPFLAAVLLLPVVAGMAHEVLDDHTNSAVVLLGLDRHGSLILFSYVLAGVFLAWTVAILTVRLDEVAQRTFSTGTNLKPERKNDAGLCAALVFASAVLMGATPTNPIGWRWVWQALAGLALWGLFLVLQWKGGFPDCYKNRHDSKVGGVLALILMSSACAALTGVLLGALLAWMDDWQTAGLAWSVLTFGPPVVLFALFVGVTLLLGLMGADYPDSAREWVSRLGALLAIWAAAWMALFCLGVFAPLWIALLFAVYWKTGVAAVGSWLVTSAAGVLSANSSRTQAGDPAGANPAGAHAVFETLAKIAPLVFLLGLLTLVSCGLHWGIRMAAGQNRLSTQKTAQELSVKLESADGAGTAVSTDRTAGAPLWALQVIDNHWQALETNPSLTGKFAIALATLFGLSLLFASRVNINEFSMHHFYKNRLVRCYMGASKGRTRQPNSWTGFDPQDDIPLKDLHAGKAYYGPYPIVNTALNLNSGSELAQQERRAGSFVYTPLYCGFTPEHSEEDMRQVHDPSEQLQEHGYRPTDGFGGKGGPHLGSAMAISGAAANPNMGYHTSGSIAFLLTVFNVRLGWWVGNPRREKSALRPGPKSSLLYLLNELTAQTNDRSHYLNLSDGGHFDNLGLYELVRRRCRYIIIGDGEQDPGLAFGSLAGAMRKCQTDFGVTIDLDVHSIQETNGVSRTHCVLGFITYPEPDPLVTTPEEYRTGLLLYFKASLTGDEPEDVREFRSRFPEFPHQSTADQFFTESQFESYRHLGLHIANTALQSVRKGSPIAEVFAQLRRDWSPPPAVAEGVATRLSAAYTFLLDQLKDDFDLQYLSAEIVPGLPEFNDTPPTGALRKGFLYCMNCIRLAESVYLDLHFQNLKERENAANQGWLAIFRYWAAQPHVREAWRNMKVTVNPHFQRFFQSLVDGD